MQDTQQRDCVICKITNAENRTSMNNIEEWTQNYADSAKIHIK